MANDVYRAVDAALILGVDDTSTAEGAAADSLVSEYDLSNSVGRLRDVTLNVSSDVKPFFEIGGRYATHLRPGVVRVTGKADRAYVNGALLRLLLGDGAVSPPSKPNFVQPSFNLVASLADPARPDQFASVNVFGVKFDTWTYRIPAEDFVMEAVSFQALRIAFEDS